MEYHGQPLPQPSLRSTGRVERRGGGVLGGLLGLYRRLMPSDDVFIRSFVAHAAKGAEASRSFALVLTDGANAAAHHEDVRRIEHEADLLAKQAKDAIHRVLVTPFDRSDILELSNGLDDIIDLMKTAGKRILRYGLPVTHEMMGMAACIEEACGELERGIPLLADVSANAAALNDMCARIDAIESRADALHEAGLERLFGPDAERTVDSLLAEQVYEAIEAVADRCEDVAKMVQGIVIEQV